MKLQRVLSLVRSAIEDYDMIQDGDKIAVGISGGKDSLTLLYALSELRRFYPHPFTLMAITVDLGFGNLDLSQIEILCKECNVPYEIVRTQISDIVFGERKEKNPCSLCSKMRKGTLNEVAQKNNCNKIAYAHHKDDVIETFLLSFFYEGRLHTFSPVTYLNDRKLSVIRPLIYMNESDINGFINKYHLSVAKNPCPADGHTKREYVKKLLENLNRNNPGIKDRMFTAIQNGSQKEWNLHAK